MALLLEEGLRGYWENPAFVIGVPLLVLGALGVLLTVFRSAAPPSVDTEGVAGLLYSPRAVWFITGAAGAALLVAGVVFHPAFAVGGGFILLASAVRLVTD